LRRREVIGPPHVWIQVKEDRRGGMVAVIHPMHLFRTDVSAFIEIDCQLEVVTKSFVARAKLAILTAGSDWGEQQRASKQKKDGFTTEDTEGFAG